MSRAQMQARPQWYYSLKSSLIGRHALGRYELFEICHKTPVTKRLQFFDLLQSLSGKDLLILYIVLSSLDTHKSPEENNAPS